MKDFFLAVKRKSSTKLIDNHYHRGGVLSLWKSSILIFSVFRGRL